MTKDTSAAIPATSFTRKQLMAIVAVNCLGYAVGPIMPLIVGALIADFALTAKSVGLIISFQLGAMALASLVISSHTDRFNLRNCCLIAVTLAIIGNGVSAATENLTLLIATRAIAGLGEGTLVACANAMASRTQKPEKTFALLGTVLATVAALLLISVPPLISEFGSAGVFGMLFALDILLLPMLFMFTSGRGAVHHGRATRVALFRGAGFTVLFAIATFTCGMGIIQTYMERIGTGVGLEVHAIGTVLAIGSLLGIFSPMLVILVGRRFGSSTPIIIATITLCALTITITSSINAIVYSTLVPCVYPVVLFLAPYQLGLMAFLDSSGRIAAAAPAFITLGAAIGPAIGGFALSSYGITGLGWTAVFCFFAGTALFLPTAWHADQSTARYGYP